VEWNLGCDVRSQAEPVKEAKWKAPTKQVVTKEEPMVSLMAEPVTIGKKVKLRQFSIREPNDLLAKGNQGRETPTSDAFANY
jgi:hypothetical protein